MATRPAEALALAGLSLAAYDAGDLGSAVRLARQAEQITADIPGWIARVCSYVLTGVLTEAGDLAAAERICAAGLARSRDAGDLWNLAGLLPKMATLDLQAGRAEDAAAHLREALQIAARTGGRADTLNGLDCCGYLCAATGRCAEAVTVWAALAALRRHKGLTDGATDARRDEPLREARQALGPARARAAEERGAAMSLATAAEYALMLTAPGPQPGRPPRRARDSSAPGNGSWSPWSPRAAPTPRSPPSCTSASARSAPTWTGSGTRPAAAAAPT